MPKAIIYAVMHIIWFAAQIPLALSTTLHGLIGDSKVHHTEFNGMPSHPDEINLAGTLLPNLVARC